MQLTLQFSSLLDDPHYVVRKRMATLALVLFDRFEAPFPPLRARLTAAIEHAQGTPPPPLSALHLHR